MPLISMLDALADAFVSRGSTATTDPPHETPMKKTPSLPNARAPADLSCTLPVVAPGMPALKASAAERQVTPRDFASRWRILSPWNEVTPKIGRGSPVVDRPTGRELFPDFAIYSFSIKEAVP